MLGCASHATKEVSQDYTATGVTSGISAYVYANHTVIEFDKEPSLAWLAPPLISITDEDNHLISYEKLGRFCRLNRKYDYFKLRVNGWLTAFFLNNKPIPTTATNENPNANLNQQANQNQDQHPSATLNPKNTNDKGIFYNGRQAKDAKNETAGVAG